jgi:hypothetical protein
LKRGGTLTELLKSGVKSVVTTAQSIRFPKYGLNKENNECFENLKVIDDVFEKIKNEVIGARTQLLESLESQKTNDVSDIFNNLINKYKFINSGNDANKIYNYKYNTKIKNEFSLDDIENIEINNYLILYTIDIVAQLELYREGMLLCAKYTALANADATQKIKEYNNTKLDLFESDKESILNSVDSDTSVASAVPVASATSVASSASAVPVASATSVTSSASAAPVASATSVASSASATYVASSAPTQTIPLSNYASTVSLQRKQQLPIDEEVDRLINDKMMSASSSTRQNTQEQVNNQLVSKLPTTSAHELQSTNSRSNGNYNLVSVQDASGNSRLVNNLKDTGVPVTPAQNRLSESLSLAKEKVAINGTTDPRFGNIRQQSSETVPAIAKPREFQGRNITQTMSATTNSKGPQRERMYV